MTDTPHDPISETLGYHLRILPHKDHNALALQRLACDADVLIARGVEESEICRILDYTVGVFLG
ncbi:hypothetical protein ACFL0V_06365 [Nanoarchaeota archaeon]